MKKTPWLLTVCVLMLYSKSLFALLHIIAAENVYGDVIKQLGGDNVEVVSILNKPTQDPHLFAITPSIALDISKADLIVLNGADYDSWMQPFIDKEKNEKYIINVAETLNIPKNANPHLWFLSETMPIFAKKVTEILCKLDKTHKNAYQKNLKEFETAYQQIRIKVFSLKKQYSHTPIIATEPIFNYMLETLECRILALSFQQKMMNDVTPSISEVKDFENNLNNKHAKLLIYNQQVISPLTLKMLALAENNHIPVMAVSEMLPPNIHYIPWILDLLNKFNGLLEGQSLS